MGLGRIIYLGDIVEELKEIYVVKGMGLTSNIYLIHDGLMVDTGNGEPVNRIAPMLAGIGKSIRDVNKVVLTHSHFDHVGGIREMALSADPEIMAHPLEHSEIKASTHVDFNLRPILEGDQISINDYNFRVLHTPGHSIGSICLYEGEKSILISGDTIFPYGGVGRVDLPTGDPDALTASIRRVAKLRVLHLLPGHEGPVLGDASNHIAYSLKNAEDLRNHLSRFRYTKIL
ncbi:MAG: MBL fold metallo-hydrolase [Candidatus Bathyarchaeia archaeon]